MKKIQPHYFVLDKDTEKTICTTDDFAVAEWMVAHYPNCFYRVALY